MELIVNLDKIDPDRVKKLIDGLKIMHIDFRMSETPQTTAEYNNDLKTGDIEIKRGNYIDARDLKSHVRNW